MSQMCVGGWRWSAGVGAVGDRSTLRGPGCTSGIMESKGGNDVKGPVRRSSCQVPQRSPGPQVKVLN